METRVDVERCTGCGDCVEACPSGSIYLNDGLAVVDQATCTQCQACMDVCPVGAIMDVELPVAVKPETIQPVREVEIVKPESVPSPTPWLNIVLAFAGREILPRLAEALIVALDRRLASQAYPPSRNLGILPIQNSGQGYRRRIRYRQRRGRG